MDTLSSTSSKRKLSNLHLCIIALCIFQVGCSGQQKSQIATTSKDKANPTVAQTNDQSSSELQQPLSSHKLIKTKMAAEMSMKPQIKTSQSMGLAHIGMSQHDIGLPQRPYVVNTKDKFANQIANRIKITEQDPISTFSIDVDTASYSTMRHWVNQGRLPKSHSVRVEELVNYFQYNYPVPDRTEAPFSISTELAPSPYADDKMLLRIGLKGYEVDKAEIGASNLVFLLDVSGSMNAQDKLPLLKRALLMLSQQLDSQDKISIVVYAGASGVVLEGASGNQYAKISQALTQLSAGGSTHGSAGINLAYQLAQKYFIQGGINRVILATDGDFNVGTTSQAALEELIEHKRESGVSLTTLGFGQGNYNDHLMEQLADKGNGQYAYIDTLNEARKVLVDEISSSLLTIAQDVKIQVEFNPQKVAEYRLIGYENRALKREDFNNDKVDAGEIGAGHSVTALYELSYTQSDNIANDPLRYPSHKAGAQQEQNDEFHNEIAFVKLRYKPEHKQASRLITQPIYANQAQLDFIHASDDFRFASAVAAFGQQLNNSPYIGDLSMTKVAQIAKGAMGDDRFGYRHEFVQLVKTADLLRQQVSMTKPQLNK